MGQMPVWEEAEEMPQTHNQVTVQTGTVQQKYSASHICNLKFSSNHIKVEVGKKYSGEITS